MCLGRLSKFNSKRNIKRKFHGSWLLWIFIFWQPVYYNWARIALNQWEVFFLQALSWVTKNFVIYHGVCSSHFMVWLEDFISFHVTTSYHVYKRYLWKSYRVRSRTNLHCPWAMILSRKPVQNKDATSAHCTHRIISMWCFLI